MAYSNSDEIFISMHADDREAFYAKIPYDKLPNIHRIGGKWMQSGKEWRFPLDDQIWEKFQKEFASEFATGKVHKDVAFLLAFDKRHKDLDRFLKFKETAMRDEPTDFGVDGVSLDGKNCLFNYQRWGVQCGLTVGDGFLIGDQPGLGKSIQALGIAIARKNRGEVRNCLIICPASLKYNWLDEVHKFTKENALVIGHKCKNSDDREKHWIAEGYFFKIVNYEIVARDLYCEPKKKDNRISCWKSVLSSFDMIVIDECQYLKHHSALRTLAVRSFNAKYRVGLSGTPIDGRLEEIHSIFQILKPGLFVSKQKFMERYAEYDYFGAVKGYHHIKEVSDKIAPYYLRRLKEEVLKDLPPKIFKDMHVELSDKNMKAYKDLIKKRNEITENSTAVELLIRARQFLDFPEILGMHNSSDKYAVFKELVDDLVKENNQKIIVFSEYTNTLHWIMKNLETEYKNILVIDGSVSSEERQEIVKKFNGEDKYKIILMSDAGAEGLNLPSAQAVVHYTDSYKPTKMQQRNDRAHRATTTHTVTIYRFITDGTIEEHVRDILAKKQAVNNALLGENCDEFETGDMSALELLSCL
jgi:SNF2 family DNA or RNA helicase